MPNSLSLSLSLWLLVISAAPAFAITHANGLKFPLVEYFQSCGGNTSTTNCATGDTSTASQNVEGTFTFDKATVEIKDNGKVCLRVDQLRPRGDCPGGLQNCRCSSGGGFCLNDGDCSDRCVVPSGSQVNVEIWAQNFSQNSILLPAPCDTSSCIRREHPPTNDCHKAFTFVVSDGSGNINTCTGIGDFHCTGYVSVLAAEIRAVEVRENITTSGELLGVMGFQHSN